MTTPPTETVDQRTARLANAARDAYAREKRDEELAAAVGASLAAGAIARGLLDAEEATYRRRLAQLVDQHRCAADCAELHSRRGHPV